jgi:hypothetical protein
VRLAKVWGSSKGRIFRIKFPLSCVAARVAVCTAAASWYPLKHITADQQQGPPAP